MYYVSHVYLTPMLGRPFMDLYIFLFKYLSYVLYSSPYGALIIYYIYSFAIYLLCGHLRFDSPLSTSADLLYSVYVYSPYLFDLSLTETVKQAYGQWLVYGEFNTLEFITRVQLVHKF